jgi:hypothetical protein
VNAGLGRVPKPIERTLRNNAKRSQERSKDYAFRDIVLFGSRWSAPTSTLEAQAGRWLIQCIERGYFFFGRQKTVINRKR